MKARIPILVALSVLALGVSATMANAAPAPVASPADASKPVDGPPSGKALVRIDGGTAYTKKTDKHTYKLLLPSGAGITWMGEVKGKGLRAGRFSHDGIVKGWARLGHRPGVGVTATVTWKDEATLVSVSDPRINAKGQLVFTARTRIGLPETLPAFSLNITRASKTPRFQDVFDPIALSSTMQVQATAGGDLSASVAFQQLDSSGAWVNCVSSSNSGEKPINPNPYNFGGSLPKTYDFGPTTCGGVSFLESTTASDGKVYVNSMTYKFSTTKNYDYTEIYGTFVLVPGNFKFQGLVAQWSYGTNGVPACPISGNSCPN